MDAIKRTCGLLWMLIGPAAFLGLLFAGIHNISSTAGGDIGNPIPWIIILCIFAPISIGLTVFGWYC